MIAPYGKSPFWRKWSLHCSPKSTWEQELCVSASFFDFALLSLKVSELFGIGDGGAVLFEDVA